MIHELEQLIIDKLNPLVSDINGTVYTVVESDGAMLKEIEDPENPGEGVYIMEPAVVVDYQSSELEASEARSSSRNFLPSPYAVEHTINITVWQPRGEGYGEFDSAIKRVLTLPKVMFEDETQRNREYMWTSLSGDEYDATEFDSARHLTMVLKITETGVDLLNLV